jgi:hypothetical protein
MDDRQAFQSDVTAVLKRGGPAADLEDVIPNYFPTVRAFRENDDLILLEGETRRLLIRRVGPDRFVTSDLASASGSTNLLDSGGEREQDLDSLIDEITAFAAV